MTGLAGILAAMIIGRRGTSVRADGVSRALMVGSAGTLFIRAGGMGFAFGTTVLLARLLGASDYGRYAWSFAWASMLALVAVLGFDRLLIRYVSTYLAREEWGLTRGVLRRANELVALGSVGLSVAMAGTAYVLFSHDRDVMWAFILGLGLVPVLALNAVRQAALQSLGRVVLSRLPDDIFRPVLFAALLVAGDRLLHRGLTAQAALGLHVATGAVTVAVGGVWLRLATPREVRDAVRVTRTRAWLREALPLWYVGGISVVLTQADILLVGALTGPTAAGIYTVASRIGAVVGLVEFAINAALSPTVARLHALNQRESLQRGISKVTAGGLIAASCGGVAVMILTPHLLSIFGAEFSGASAALRLLSLSYIVSAAAGQNGVILMMTGHAAETARGTSVAVAINVALNLVLIPLDGLTGAAWAWLATVVIWNALLAWRVYRLLNIDATVLGVVYTLKALRSSRA